MFKKMASKIFSIILGLIKYMPFVSAMRLRGFCYRFVLKKAGRHINICDGVTMVNPAGISIGNNVSIHEYTGIGGIGEVVIGDYVAIASHCRIVSDKHNFSDKNLLIKKQGATAQRVVIGNNVWIGSHVTVLGDVTIGEGAVIGAGSVVTKDIPPNAVAFGVPCRVVRFR
jgi:acetyltransferase-like isoleucine patch superfamily enzyme